MLTVGFFRANVTRSRLIGAGLQNNTSLEVITGRGKNRLIGQGMSDRASAVPHGYLAPQAWLLGIVSGGLGTSHLNGDATEAFNLAGGLGAEATISSIGELNATGQIVASLIATLSGSGLVSDADMRALLDAVANLAGAGTAAADIEALGWAEALLAGTSALGLVPYAVGSMEAEIIPGSAGDTLTPGQIADAVWNAAVAAYQSAGTMGEVQDNGGGGSFPGGQFWP